MTGRIEIDFALNEGAVLRMVGLVERRGFEVRSIRMDDLGEGRGALALGVRARDQGRSLAIVAGHLRRLYDVRSVSCSTHQPPQFEPANQGEVQ